MLEETKFVLCLTDDTLVDVWGVVSKFAIDTCSVLVFSDLVVSVKKVIEKDAKLLVIFEVFGDKDDNLLMTGGFCEKLVVTEDKEDGDFDRVVNSESVVEAEELLIDLDAESVCGVVCMLNDLLVERDVVFLFGICVSQEESVQEGGQIHEYPPCVLVQFPLF